MLLAELRSGRREISGIAPTTFKIRLGPKLGLASEMGHSQQGTSLAMNQGMAIKLDPLCNETFEIGRQADYAIVSLLVYASKILYNPKQYHAEQRRSVVAEATLWEVHLPHVYCSTS